VPQPSPIVEGGQKDINDISVSSINNVSKHSFEEVDRTDQPTPSNNSASLFFLPQQAPAQVTQSQAQSSLFFMQNLTAPPAQVIEAEP